MPPDSARPELPAQYATWDPDTARRHAAGLARRISFGLAGLLVCLWLAILASTWSVWNTSLHRVEASANNLSAAFQQEVFQVMDRVAAAIDVTTRQIQADPSGFRLEKWAAQLPAVTNPISYAGFVNASGKLVSTTMTPSVEGIDLRFREHISVQLSGPNPGLFISVPLIGTISGKPVIQVSCRVTAEDGHIIGVLVFSIPPDGLSVLHRSIEMGPRGIMALIGTDGRLRARYGKTEPALPVDRPVSWPLAIPDGAETAVIRSAAVEGITRVYSLRRLPGYPLYVAAGLDFDDEMAEARGHAILAVGIGIAASALLAALYSLLVREIRRRGERELQLAREQEAVQKARAELAQEQEKLAVVSEELSHSTARAEAANRAKAQFLAQMSHELRTPLHAVIGFSELIAAQASPLPDAGQIGDYANDIMKSGRHLLELINSILDLAKVDSGAATLNEEVVPLRDLILDSMVTIRGQAMERGVRLDTRLPADSPLVQGDPTKLRQILINLMANAVKFTPNDGAVTISARRGPDGTFSTVISDTGIGMTESEMAVAMEPFGQVENSLARAFEGTGLGLPLAKRLTELHSGRLTMRSVKGVGTSVEVCLPAWRIIDPPKPSAPSAQPQDERLDSVPRGAA